MYAMLLPLVQADLKESEGVIAHLRQLEREAQEIANAYV